MAEIDIHKAIEQTKTWVQKKIEDISQIKTEGFRKILYFSLIDSFAQSWRDYPTNGVAKNFAEFLLAFSNEYREVLQKVCPITLYHHYCDKYNFDKLQLPAGRLLQADSAILEKESARLLLFISDQQQREFVRDKHRYCQLMYAERNKLVHELTQVGMPIDFDKPLPHVAMGRYISKQGTTEPIWNLVIPEKFIISVLQDAIKGYLSQCEQQKIVPFSNNAYDRKSRMAWYD